ncbi:MAG TPA: hypothetical protein VFX96_07710 [Pyrinomonadaceae bacterium]|nr:hypothetical protein [Pyrinomonadaceae bacterium]
MLGLIQIVEAALDAFEYRLALRQRARAERRRDLAASGRLVYERNERTVGARQLASEG